MLENPERLRKMVHESGAKSTDMTSPEPVDDLCNKTTPYADRWKVRADELWAENRKVKEEKKKQREEMKKAE